MKTSNKIVIAGSFFLLLVPQAIFAKPYLSEIAWMGTSASANAEWIELGNSGPDPAVLDGYSLEADDGQPKIALKGSIAAGGYFLLERTSDQSVPDIPADQVYTGSLGNEGEILRLKDASGAVIGLVDGHDAWKISGGSPAGDNATKDTAQWNGTAWITAPATPRAANASAGVPAPQDASGLAGSSSTAGSLAVGSSSSSLSIPESSHSDPEPLTDEKDAAGLSVGAGRDRIAPAGSPVAFRANVRGSAAPLSAGASGTAPGTRERKSFIPIISPATTK